MPPQRVRQGDRGPQALRDHVGHVVSGATALGAAREQGMGRRDCSACRNCITNASENDHVLESSGGCPALRASPVRRKIVNRRCRTGDCAARASGSVKPVAELNSYWAEAVLCVECRLPGPMQLCASTLESGVRALCSGGHVVLFWPFSECGSRPAARIRDPLCAPPHVH